MFHHVISAFDPCSYLAVAVALQVTAWQVGNAAHRYASGMVWTGVAALLLVGGVGYLEARPEAPLEVMAVAVVAWIAATGSSLATAVVLPVIQWLHRGWAESVRERAEAERQRAEDQKRREEEEKAAKLAASIVFPRSEPPRKPTQEELAAAIRARYELTVRLLRAAGLTQDELQGGIQKAKQKMLNDLDEIL